VVINFTELPNEGGIQVTGTSILGNPFSVSSFGAETFRIGAQNYGGSDAGLKLSSIGVSGDEEGSTREFLFNILESAGGPLSDQIHVFSPSKTVIDFISDPAQFVTGAPNSVLVETGVLQFGGSYFSDNGTLVTINFLSDVDGATVPEPSSFLLTAMSGLAAVASAYWRRRPESKPKAGHAIHVAMPNI